MKFGGSLRYVVVVQNKGPHAAKDVVVTDTLPDGAFTLVDLPKTCRFESDANTLTCRVGTIAAGSGTTIEFLLDGVNFGNVGDNFSNSATVTGEANDPNTTNNTSTRTSVIR